MSYHGVLFLDSTGLLTSATLARERHIYRMGSLGRAPRRVDRCH